MTLPELIPLEILLGNPEKMSPQISPDGKRLGYIAPVDGVLNVWVGSVRGTDFAPVTKDTDRGIHSYVWAHDNRHLLYIQDSGGDENFRLHTVDLDSGEIVDRTPFVGVQARVIASRKRFPSDVLVGLNRDNPQLHDIYRLDLASGELRKVVDNPGFVAWLVDADLKVRGAAAQQPDGGVAILVRDTEDAEWRPLLEVASDDALTTGPIGFTNDGASMYLQSSVDANTARLVKIDMASGAVEVLASDPTYDLVDVLIHPDTREPQMAAFLKERVEWVVLDPSIREDVEAIRRVHAGDFGISDRDHADRTWIVGFDDDDGPLKYFAFDRESKEATFLFDHRPALNAYDLAPMEPVGFKARDGLELNGYLSFPVGVERSGLPTVINVHGGPWHRDSWGFDPEAQWMANRGYLCVQVNFRGSTGYGKDFVNAGDREWGGKMQDDVTDTVRWVIDQGYADPERICIYGGSYGGYATLAGATFTPELYRCAVSIVGPSNLKTWIETVPPYRAPMIALLHKRVGNPETDEEFLWSRSPLSRVEDISIPMIIAHGANDPRVKLSETEQIVAAMKEKGIDHELMVFD
ncbi:MAG: prolyl oligopeptidase family serine peptidase, partial [Actinomycetota bacterium]